MLFFVKMYHFILHHLFVRRRGIVIRELFLDDRRENNARFEDLNLRFLGSASPLRIASTRYLASISRTLSNLQIDRSLGTRRQNEVSSGRLEFGNLPQIDRFPRAALQDRYSTTHKGDAPSHLSNAGGERSSLVVRVCVLSSTGHWDADDGWAGV